MRLPASTYYYRARQNPEKHDRIEGLKARIEAISREFSGYGQRRIYQQLRREAYAVNHKQVERLVRQMNLQCRQARAYRPTTNSKHSFPRSPNLIRDVLPVRPNQIWVADITYIRLSSAFVYLAVILDLFSRKAIGYAMSVTLKATLAVEALTMAVAKRKPSAGCIHHSDQGIQYAADEYTAVLKAHGLASSMSAKGNPYQNANAESFFKTFKYEEVYLNDYRSLEDAMERVPSFIEDVYNAKRLHSSLGYKSPIEFEASFANSLPGITSCDAEGASSCLASTY